jgi:hypothetical protein
MLFWDLFDRFSDRRSEFPKQNIINKVELTV